MFTNLKKSCTRRADLHNYLVDVRFCAQPTFSRYRRDSFIKATPKLVF